MKNVNVVSTMIWIRPVRFGSCWQWMTTWWSVSGSIVWKVPCPSDLYPGGTVLLTGTNNQPVLQSISPDRWDRWAGQEGSSGAFICQYHAVLPLPNHTPSPLPHPSLPPSPSSWTGSVGFRRYYSVPGCGLVSGHWDKCLWMNFTQYWVNTSIDTDGRWW